MSRFSFQNGASQRLLVSRKKNNLGMVIFTNFM